MIDFFVQSDYMADDAQSEILNRFLEAYLLWSFGYMMFCKSQGDADSKFVIPYARMITDTPLEAVPQISWGNTILSTTYRGVVHGRVQGCTKGGV
jgi:hypothetical protein